MADLLRKAQLPELSYYQAVGKSAERPSKRRGRKESTASIEDSPPDPAFEGVAAQPIDATALGAEKPIVSTASFQPQPQYAIDREENGATSLVTAPMGSLYEVTQLSDIRATSPERQYATDRALVTDFVSRGAVELHEAEELFDHFDRVLNRYLWDGILLVHKDLTALRNSSSMLSAAILAVTALHLPNKERTFDTCYTEFAKLASESMLDRHHTLDDLRALCIGAFWLADVSWKLSGYAVRIATERNLHQAYRKATLGSPEHKEQARLWYLLYVRMSPFFFYIGLVLTSADSGASLFNRLWEAAHNTRRLQHHESPYLYSFPVSAPVRSSLA
jgi:hypothetical protein